MNRDLHLRLTTVEDLRKRIDVLNQTIISAAYHILKEEPNSALFCLRGADLWKNGENPYGGKSYPTDWNDEIEEESVATNESSDSNENIEDPLMRFPDKILLAKIWATDIINYLHNKKGLELDDLYRQLAEVGKIDEKVCQQYLSPESELFSLDTFALMEPLLGEWESAARHELDQKMSELFNEQKRINLILSKG